MVNKNLLSVLSTIAVIAILSGLVLGDYQKWSNNETIEHGSATFCATWLTDASVSFTTQWCSWAWCRSWKWFWATWSREVTRRVWWQTWAWQEPDVVPMGNYAIVYIDKYKTVSLQVSYDPTCAGIGPIPNVVYKTDAEGINRLESVNWVARDDLSDYVMNKYWTLYETRQQQEKDWTYKTIEQRRAEALAARRAEWRETVGDYRKRTWMDRDYSQPQSSSWSEASMNEKWNNDAASDFAPVSNRWTIDRSRIPDWVTDEMIRQREEMIREQELDRQEEELKKRESELERKNREVENIQYEEYTWMSYETMLVPTNEPDTFVLLEPEVKAKVETKKPTSRWAYFKAKRGK